MTTTHLGRAEQGRSGSKPAIGMLLLLVAGPSIALPLAIGSATALMMLVGVAWMVAGPRL